VRNACRSDGHLSLSECSDSLQIFGQPVGGFPCVMTRLHIQPQVRSVAAQLAESHCHVGGHRRVTFHHAIGARRLTPNSIAISPTLRRCRRNSGRILRSKKTPRCTGGRVILSPLNNKFLGQSYYLKILVILFQINSEGSETSRRFRASRPDTLTSSSGAEADHWSLRRALDRRAPVRPGLDHRLATLR